MKYIILSLLLLGNSCSSMQNNHHSEIIKSISHTNWIFKERPMDLFDGDDTPINKSFVFSQPKFDPNKIVYSHAAPQGQRWFKLEFLSNGNCRLTWSRTVAHVVTGTSVSSYALVVKWEVQKDDILIHYERSELIPVSPSFKEGYKEHIPSTYTHTCKVSYKLENGNLILTPIEIIKR